MAARELALAVMEQALLQELRGGRGFGHGRRSKQALPEMPRLHAVVPAQAGTHTPQSIESPVAMGHRPSLALGRDDSEEGAVVCIL